MAYKMKNGRWRGERVHDGARKTKVFDSKREAYQWEASLRPKDFAPPPPTETIPTALSLATEYLDYCKAEMGRRTYEEKAFHFKKLFASMEPDTPFQDIPAKTVYDILRDRASVSGHAANRCRKDLLAWGHWAKKIYKIDSLEAFDQPKFRADETPRHVPTEEEFWKVYHVADPNEQVFLLTMLHTGARRGELVRLQWSDIDFKARTIRLSTRKRTGGLTSAVIPLTEQASQALTKHKQVALRGLSVFTHDDGSSFSRDIERIMGKLSRAAGVKPFGFHAVRHLSASILGRAGVPLPTIQAILRHQNATTTSRYLHSLGVVADVLDGVFGQPHTAVPHGRVVNIK